MSLIRDAILKRMRELNVTTYRLSKMVTGKVPQRTIYAFCSGESDASSEVVSAIMEALGMTIATESKGRRGKRPRKEI
jgi:predicted transcriptional regulator